MVHLKAHHNLAATYLSAFLSLEAVITSKSIGLSLTPAFPGLLPSSCPVSVRVTILCLPSCSGPEHRKPPNSFCRPPAGFRPCLPHCFSTP